MAEVTETDRRHLAYVFDRVGGKAWEPPAPFHPWLSKLVEAGLLERKDGRCGFEAFKDSFVDFTAAGRQAVADYNAAAAGAVS
ncbi:MAG TPA: hypothetical protein VF605_11780 [Allosphingosinicella sp.]|jgi:hypothetical protein